MESLPSHVDKAGSHHFENDVDPGTVVTPQPLIANDHVHDEDGGHDLIGLRRRDARQSMTDELFGVLQRDGLVEAWGNVTDTNLDYNMVTQARQAEIDYFKNMQVCTQVPRTDAKRSGGEISYTRWIDVNKNDEKRSDYISRSVGKGTRRGTDDSLYAAAPPLEGLRTIISYAATCGDHNNDYHHNPTKHKQRKHLIVNLCLATAFSRRLGLDIDVAGSCPAHQAGRCAPGFAGVGAGSLAGLLVAGAPGSVYIGAPPASPAVKEPAFSIIATLCVTSETLFSRAKIRGIVVPTIFSIKVIRCSHLSKRSFVPTPNNVPRKTQPTDKDCKQTESKFDEETCKWFAKSSRNKSPDSSMLEPRTNAVALRIGLTSQALACMRKWSE